MFVSRDFSYDSVTGVRAARTWSDPQVEPTHVVLLVHGYGEHISRYEHVAAALVANGAAVYGVDHIGHGRSEGERVLIEDFEQVVSDVHVLDETARREHPGLPVALIGHSMGGLIGARYLQRYGDSLATAVLSGPVIGTSTVAHALLTLDAMPEDPLDVSVLSRDDAVGQAYAADPLVWHGPFKRPTVEAMARAADAACPCCGYTGWMTSWWPWRTAAAGLSTCAATFLSSDCTTGRGTRCSTRPTATRCSLTSSPSSIGRWRQLRLTSNH